MFNSQKSREGTGDIRVIHFTAGKPWVYKDIPGYKIYRKYRSTTPFYFNAPDKRKYTTIARIDGRIYLLTILRWVWFGRYAVTKITQKLKLKKQLAQMAAYDKLLNERYLIATVQ